MAKVNAKGRAEWLMRRQSYKAKAKATVPRAKAKGKGNGKGKGKGSGDLGIPARPGHMFLVYSFFVKPKKQLICW